MPCLSSTASSRRCLPACCILAARAGSYADEEVLHDVSLEIREGRIVGISGRSGSGKSTFCRLLMRFWDADAGSIRIGDADIRSVRTGHLRGLEAFVEQDSVLFHESIRENLLKWLRTSSITAGIPAAAPLHHMDERLMHPEERRKQWRRAMQAV